MLKKIIWAVLSLCLLFGISAMAENTVNQDIVPAASSEVPAKGGFDPSQMPQGDFDPSKMPQGGFDSSKMPRGDFDPSKMPQGGFDPSQMPEGSFMPPSGNGTMADNIPNAPKDSGTENGKSQKPEEGAQTNDENASDLEIGNRTDDDKSAFGGGLPGDSFPGTMQDGVPNTEEEQQIDFFGFVRTYATPITSVILLALAYLFVFLYKRKHY